MSPQVGKPVRALKPARFSVIDLRRLQRKFKFSGVEIKGVAAAVRVVAGRKSIESNLNKKITVMNHEYDDLFFSKEIEIKVKESADEEDKIIFDDFLKELYADSVNLDIIECLNDDSDELSEEESDYCEDELISDDKVEDGYKLVKKIGCFSDTEEVLSCVMMKRGLTADNCDIVCGIDGGQGSLKVCLQTLPKAAINSQTMGRSKYSDGVAAKESLLSSVNRLILLGLVPNCPENHHNISVIMRELGLISLEFVKSVDIKLVMILVGKSAGKPKYGCPFCSSAQPFKEKGKLYTLSRLVELNESYISAGCPRDSQMKYENMTNPPVLTSSDPDKTVLDLVVPPELHLLIGSVDKLMKEIENNIFYVPKKKPPMEASNEEMVIEDETASDVIQPGQDISTDAMGNKKGKVMTAKERKAAKAAATAERKEAKSKAAAEKKAAKVVAAAEEKAAKQAEKARKKTAKAAGRKFMNEYLKQPNVSLVRKSYQGAHSLEGNQSRTFLKKIDLLEITLLKQPSQVILNGLPYLAALRALDKVVGACFSVDLDPAYPSYIEIFKEAYCDLDISITPKVHIIFQHIEEFLLKQNLNRVKKVGLGHFSEQSLESSNHDVNLLWQRVKVSEDHPEHAQRLKHFCSSYFASHI